MRIEQWIARILKRRYAFYTQVERSTERTRVNVRHVFLWRHSVYCLLESKRSPHSPSKTYSKRKGSFSLIPFYVVLWGPRDHTERNKSHIVKSRYLLDFDVSSSCLTSCIVHLGNYHTFRFLTIEELSFLLVFYLLLCLEVPVDSIQSAINTESPVRLMLLEFGS